MVKYTGNKRFCQKSSYIFWWLFMLAFTHHLPIKEPFIYAKNMAKRVFPIVMLIVFEATADYFATKRGNGGQKLTIALLALFFYLVCNTFWLFALKNGVWLGKGNIIFAVWSSILAIALWVLVFHEHYSPIQIAGLGLGIISLLLVNLE